jgi:hypothetical protein
MAVDDIFGTADRQYRVAYLVPPTVAVVGPSNRIPTQTIAQDLYGDAKAAVDRRDANSQPSDQGVFVVVDEDRLLDQWQNYFINDDSRSHIPPGSVVAGGQVVNVHISQYAGEADLLRDLYQKGANVIQSAARGRVAGGEELESVARWVVRARNQLKVSIRAQGPALFKQIAEARNRIKYGNSAGPTYEQLRIAKTDEQIIARMTETSTAFNRSGQFLRSVGLTLEVASFVVAATQDSPDSLPPLPKSEDDQVKTEITRLRLGIPFDANIDTHGHLKKNSYLQIDPMDFAHAGDEMDQETEEILWFFGVPVSYTFRGVRWTVPGRKWR